jgi:mono/diheme cytochrome c family protein
MYRSPAYAAYDINAFYKDSVASRKPVAGTIARGMDIPYGYPNTPAGYDSAGLHLKNPYTVTPEMVTEGQRLFKQYCMHCHGETGMGDGKIIQNEKFPAPPAYSGALKDLPEGKMFHTITYGKNLMGPHATLLSPKERWTIISFVQTLQRAGQATAAPATDSSATATVK